MSNLPQVNLNIPLYERDPWHAEAACRGLLGQVNFHPDPTDHEAIRAAISVCQECPVIDPCFEAGLANREDGIWGGTTERERNRYLRTGSLFRQYRRRR